MKKLILLLYLTCATLIFGQNYKILYQFSWKSQPSDTLRHNELTVLSKNGDESYFSSLAMFQRDSIKTVMVNDMLSKGTQIKIPDLSDDSKFFTIVTKSVKNNGFSVEQLIYDKVYITDYDCKQNWKILSEKASILGYKAQKAETEFGGRKWSAWFSNEIPVNDGPYKFYGLPGLILKISDSENNFTFEIKGITKQTTDLLQRNFIFNKVNLTPKQWDLFWQKYKRDPSMIFANLNNEQTTYVINGKNVDDKEVKESYNKSELKKINYFENPIETKNCGYR